MDLTETLFRVKKNDLHFSLDLRIYEFLTRINVTNSAVSLNTRVIIGSGSILDLIGIWWGYSDLDWSGMCYRQLKTHTHVQG